MPTPNRTLAALAALLFGAAAARGQDPFGTLLAPGGEGFAPSGLFLAPLLPGSTAFRLWSYGERRFAFRTRRDGGTRDRYAADALDSGLDAPLRMGRREGLLQARFDVARLDGRLSNGDLPGHFGAFEASVARPLDDRVTLALCARVGEDDARYVSDLLGNTFSLLGTDPDLHLQLEERSFGAVAHVAAGGLRVHLGLGLTDLDGSIRAEGANGRLALPLAMNGRDATLLVERPTSPGTLEFRLEDRSFRGADDVTREGDRKVGRGRADYRSDLVGLGFRRDLRNGGRLHFGLERSTLRLDATGSVPKASNAGLDAPAGSSASYHASAGVGRTEASVRWEAPQRRGRLLLGYRHALVQADASAGYALRLLLIGTSDEASKSLDATHVGIFDVGYERALGRFDIRFVAEQIVPFRTGSGGSGGVVSSGGAPRTDGGWTLGLTVGKRF